jgi:hypothetical protein
LQKWANFGRDFEALPGEISELSKIEAKEKLFGFILN